MPRIEHANHRLRDIGVVAIDMRWAGWKPRIIGAASSLYSASSAQRNPSVDADQRADHMLDWFGPYQ